MNIRVLFLTAILGLVGGTFIGVTTQNANASSTVFTVRVNPGGPNAYLNCSWHSACTTPPTPGPDLDWQDETYNHEARFRGWNYRSDTSTQAAVGSVSTTQDNGTCKHVIASVKDNLSNSKGSIDFTHTDQAGYSSFTLYGHNSFKYETRHVADIVEERLSCIAAGYWTGEHLHQGLWSGSWSPHYSKYTSTGTQASIYSVNDYQYYQGWIY